MKTVALISGGKDSCYNMMCCVAEGHEVVALANLRPEKEGKQELDSYMFQTVGHTAIDLYAEALGLPLYVQSISGSSLATGSDYKPCEGDEVEDLYKLLQAVKEDVTIEAVSVGAILSDYQRVRVENVCSRLGLTVLSFLWRRDQEELLQEIIDCGVKAKIIKVAALGLKPDAHLGLELAEIQPHMIEMKAKYGLNVCGEGGEYETFVFDCPLFRHRINIESTEQVIHSDDAFAPVGYLVLKQCSLLPKPNWDSITPLSEQIRRLPVMTSIKWLVRCEPEYGSVDPAPTTVATVTLGAESGGGDSTLPSVVMCVPDVSLTGAEPPVFKSDGENFQISGVRAVTGRDVDLSLATEVAMNSLKDCVMNHNMTMEDIASVSLCVSDMSNFAAINAVYKGFFDINPPVRVCVEANLPRNVAMQLDCQGHRVKASTESEGSHNNSRKVLHVQALSHWAPANIGPYSQAVVANDKLYMAGIIPLVPATLDLIKGDIATQSCVALTHVQTIMSVISPRCDLARCPQVTCYITCPEFIPVARQTWEDALKNCRAESKESHIVPYVQYVQVSALPKAASVEWHVSAWPQMDDGADDQITVHREVQQFDKYSVRAVGQVCSRQHQHFSCNIAVEVTSMDFVQQIDKPTHPTKMVELYCQVWKKCFPSGTEVSPPLVKIFFSPTMFDYSLLHKYFTDAVHSVCLSHAVPGPVLSLIPVSGLDSSKQILAWCQ